MAVQPPDEKAAVPVPMLQEAVRPRRWLPQALPSAGYDHEGRGPVLLGPRAREDRAVPGETPPGPRGPEDRPRLVKGLGPAVLRFPEAPRRPSPGPEPALRREA